MQKFLAIYKYSPVYSLYGFGNMSNDDATEPQGSAFLIGKISEIRRPADPDDSDRWLIAISEYAISVPEAWKHWCNPVRSTWLTD